MAVSGLGSVAVHSYQALKTRRPHGAGVQSSAENGFGGWADEIWEAAKTGLFADRRARRDHPQHSLSGQRPALDKAEGDVRRTGRRLGRPAQRADAGPQLFRQYARRLADRLPGSPRHGREGRFRGPPLFEISKCRNRGDQPVAQKLAGRRPVARLVPGHVEFHLRRRQAGRSDDSSGRRKDGPCTHDPRRRRRPTKSCSKPASNPHPSGVNWRERYAEYQTNQTGRIPSRCPRDRGGAKPRKRRHAGRPLDVHRRIAQTVSGRRE